MKRATIAVLVAGAALAGAAGAAQAQTPPWTQIVHGALGAEYAVGVGQSVWADFFGSRPAAMCTGWQAVVDGQVREYTAVHCVGYWVQGHYTPSGAYDPTHWDVWGQVDVRGLRGPWVHEAGLWAPSNTQMWGYDDVTYTLAEPLQPGSIVGVGSGAPLASRYFTIAGWRALYPGEPCIVVGDGDGGWFDGNSATVNFLTFRGFQHGFTYQTEGGTMPPYLQLGWAEIFSGSSIAGESGAPIIDPQGQVVGVLVAGGGGETMAVPINQEGVPVVAPGQPAQRTLVEGYGN